MTLKTGRTKVVLTRAEIRDKHFAGSRDALAMYFSGDEKQVELPVRVKSTGRRMSFTMGRDETTNKFYIGCHVFSNAAEWKLRQWALKGLD